MKICFGGRMQYLLCFAAVFVSISLLLAAWWHLRKPKATISYALKLINAQPISLRRVDGDGCYSIQGFNDYCAFGVILTEQSLIFKLFESSARGTLKVYFNLEGSLYLVSMVPGLWLEKEFTPLELSLGDQANSAELFQHLQTAVSSLR